MTSPVEPMSGVAEHALGIGRARTARAGLLTGQGGVRERSERSLIAGALAGSERDLEGLFVRHWPHAYRAAYLIVGDHAAAEDIAQEAFLAAVRRLDWFDRRRRFGPWLSAIVANRAIDWTRARTARRESGLDPIEMDAAAPEPVAVGYSPEVLAALRDLALEQRVVVVLRYVLEYTPGEIARALELPRGTVNSRLRRGLDALEKRLGEIDR
jgi:RNA polymerase sigma-70 factor (ECF subfamily)